MEEFLEDMIEILGSFTLIILMLCVSFSVVAVTIWFVIY